MAWIGDTCCSACGAVVCKRKWWRASGYPRLDPSDVSTLDAAPSPDGKWRYTDVKFWGASDADRLAGRAHHFHSDTCPAK